MLLLSESEFSECTWKTTSDAMEMIGVPSVLVVLENQSPNNLAISRRRSNRKVSVDSEDQFVPFESSILASTSLTGTYTKSSLIEKSLHVDALTDTVQEISASEDSDSDTSIVVNPSQFVSTTKSRASSESSIELPAELKELAHLMEYHHKDVIKSTKGNLDLEWILARASPVLKAHVAQNQSLFSDKNSTLGTVVQAQWRRHFRKFRSQLRDNLKDSGIGTSVALIPPFQPIEHTKMPLVLQELAHILEVHDYNFRPSKQGQISWDWVQKVSSPVLAKHILCKQKDPNVRKSYKKCPTAALVTSTHYAEFRKVRKRIWNQLVSEQPTKTSITLRPLCDNFTTNSKTTVKVKRSSDMASTVMKKSPVSTKVKKGVNAVSTPKVTVPTTSRKRGRKKTFSCLTSEQRELAHLLEEVRLRDRNKRVVFDKEYIQANASPALIAYITERSLLPTFQKNILRALVSANMKNIWEDYRLQLRKRMEKEMLEYGLFEERPIHFGNVEDNQEKKESTEESEEETVHQSTQPRQRIVDMRHHAADAFWLAPSQRMQILESAGDDCLSDISDGDAAMVLDEMRNVTRPVSGDIPVSKRSRLGDSLLSLVDVKTAKASSYYNETTNVLPAILQELAKLLEDQVFNIRHPDNVSWEWIKKKASPDLCLYLCQTHEIFPEMRLDDIVPSYNRNDFDSLRDKIRSDLGTKGVDVLPLFKTIESDPVLLDFIDAVLIDEMGMSRCMVDLALKIEQSAVKNKGSIDWTQVSSQVTSDIRELIADHLTTPGFSANPELFLVPFSDVIWFSEIRKKLASILRQVQSV